MPPDGLHEHCTEHFHHRKHFYPQLQWVKSHHNQTSIRHQDSCTLYTFQRFCFCSDLVVYVRFLFWLGWLFKKCSCYLNVPFGTLLMPDMFLMTNCLLVLHFSPLFLNAFSNLGSVFLFLPLTIDIDVYVILKNLESCRTDLKVLSQNCL